jgi:hypothetical protein
MTQAEAFAGRVRRLVRNRQGTEAQVWLEAGFLYLRADGHARFARGEGADLLQGFALLRDGVELAFSDGSRLWLRHRLGRLEKRWGYFS